MKHICIILFVYLGTLGVACGQVEFRPNMHGIYVDLLPLPPTPVVGTGVEYDIFATPPDMMLKDDLHAFGVHVGIESGVDMFGDTRNKKEMFFTDSDIMMYYRYGLARSNLSAMAGWAYRDVDSWDHAHTSGRFKYGVIANFTVLSGKFSIDAKVKIMFSSFGRSYQNVEVAPASAGISFGWYEW